MSQPSHDANEVAAPPPGPEDPLRAESGALLAENLELMALLARLSRSLGLCATLDLEPLCERIVESLCFETRARAGLLWLATGEAESRWRLVAAWSAGAPAQDPRDRTLPQPPDEFAGRGEPVRSAVLVSSEGADEHVGLVVRLCQDGRLLAVARLTDALEASGFGPREVAAAEQIADAAAAALANALRLRAAERRSLRDPRTRTCTPAFFDGLVATELEKALRFGRPLSLIEGIVACELAPGSDRSGRGARSAGEHFAERLQQAVRGTDLCAAEGDARVRLLLPETDALGAAVLERRLRELAYALYAETTDRPPDGGSIIRVATATFPADGTHLEELRRRLDERLDDERHGGARALGRPGLGFAACRQRLLRQAVPVPPRLPEQALRFALEELRRSAAERALVWLAPGAELEDVAIDGLTKLRGQTLRAEIVLITDQDPGALVDPCVTWLPTQRVGVRPGFLVYLGETPAYAWLREREGEGAPLFHSSDRAVVAHLAFELQHDLGGAPAS